jgi:TPR repeat protein
MKPILIALFCLLLLGCGQGPTTGGQEEMAPPLAAVDEDMSLAKEGDAAAQERLGLRYLNAKDFKEAFKWYQKAADQGNVGAQNNLGSMYNLGEGVEQDFKEAVKWYQKAADQGDAIAQDNLGGMYVRGQGVLEDDKEAVKWYQKSANQGYAMAQNNLGAMYVNGKGVEQNYVTAYAWFNMAAANGEKLGEKNKGILAGKVTPEQIAKAQELSKEMVKKNPKLLNK